MDDVMKAAREAAARALAHHVLAQSETYSFSTEQVNPGHADPDRDGLIYVLDGSFDLDVIADAAISAYEAKLDESGWKLVARDLMLKITDHADAGRDYWFSEYYTGDQREKERNAEWAKDVEEARALLAATSPPSTTE